MSGKKDFKKVAKGFSKQKQILLNYLQNLYNLFWKHQHKYFIVFLLSHAANTFLCSEVYFKKCLIMYETPKLSALKLKITTSVGGKISTNLEIVAKISVEEMTSIANELVANIVVFPT